MIAWITALPEIILVHGFGDFRELSCLHDGAAAKNIIQNVMATVPIRMVLAASQPRSIRIVSFMYVFLLHPPMYAFNS